ncbi:sterile alpha motif domain-containing protein 9-like, partial [Anneissia japonica]|uniref:sterile alpha motif domain-containing protein 9-like n=1 Tax=Anneissia japonica TaxID=1529436 RepID=UPI001425950E
AKIKELSQQSKTLQAVFQWIHLYHQPGAGASTVIKHILWEFRKKYRCIILNKITDQTESQILEMWSYGEESDDRRLCLPIVIVSDNLCYDDLSDMIISLEYKTKNIPDRTCIILNCRRNLSRKEGKNEQSESHHYNFSLEHSLSDKEKAWFQNKHDQLEVKLKKDKDFMPDRLLTFMVMKEEFQSEYVKKTVSRILSNLQEQHPQELELIKFCALFSKFERDSAIPIPCCDEFMGFTFSVKKKRECPWEYDISEGSSLLMIKVDIFEVGSVQGFKIVHPKVADFILKDTTSEPLNSIVDNYLSSKLLITKSHSREYLAARTHDLLIKSNPTGFDPSNKPAFSALILAITEVDREAACRVLILGFHILEDPMIAQQIARYYSLVIEDYTKALEFIEKAIDMRKENSFLWDTKGQIYRKEFMRSFYYKYVVRHEVLSIDDSFRVLQLALKGIDSFHQSQSRVDRKDNTSCFSGEVDITFKLLDVLTSLDVLLKSANGRQILQRYLIDKSYKPSEL